MRKHFLKILLVILVILIILFLKACVTYRTKGKYTINSHEKYNIEKFTKIPNLKSVDILYSGKINFILYDNTCNLVLRKIEIYYKNKLLGRTNININICKLENLNETEKKKHKSNTISTIFQAFGEDLGLEEPISFGTIKGAAEIKMDANEFKKMLEDHKNGKIPTTNIDAYLNNELDADDDVAMYKYLKEKLDKMDEEL